MPKMIRVRRKGYRRKDGTWVKGTTFLTKDRGKPGRGPKVVKISHEGALGGPGYTGRSQVSRHRSLASSVRQDGYAATMRRLNALRVFGSRTMSPAAKRKIAADMRWLKAHHGK